MPIELMRGQFVDSEPAALRDGADFLEYVFVAAGARLHMDDHVRGHNLRDAALDRVTGGVRLFETRGAGNTDGDVHEIALPGAAHANALASQHALRLVH